MIAQFPVFTKLTLAQQKDIKNFTSKFDSYSDFNFTSLYSWNVDGTTAVSFLNDNLVIKLPDYVSGKTIYSILGSSQLNRSLKTLLQHTEKLHLVPQVVVNQLNNTDGLKISPDPSNFDYLYDLSTLATLGGKKYKGKRYKTNNFLQTFNHRLDVSKSNFIDPQKKKDILKVCDQWAKENKRDTEWLGLEREAINRLLLYSDSLDLLVTSINIDGRMVGFSVNEILNRREALCHFEKAVSIHGNIFAFTVNQASKDLLEAGCTIVNWEQDLGIEGLRKSKSSYHPVHFLKKYVIQES